MNESDRLRLALLVIPALAAAAAHAEPAHPGWQAPEEFFTSEVWPKVASSSCLKCHKQGGDAEESELILQDPRRTGDAPQAMQHNLATFLRLAKQQEDGRPRILRKVVGELDHGGEDVLRPDSTRYRILADFVALADPSRPAPAPAPPAIVNREPFFEGVRMLDERRLLRRLTLSLAARLPSPEELFTIESGGLPALDTLLDELMTEKAFYDRLAEGFNDIFLTTGIDDVAENVLSYEHFEQTRHWYQKWDFSHIQDERERERAGWALARVYREAIEREPMELVKYIVRNERPFTEILTADYIMVSPYTSRGYGIFEEVADRFRDLEDHLEFIPVRLKALTGRSERTNQYSATGFYPHAGLLSTFQYLKRYPTTETNRNRLRVRMFFQHFLGIDIMQLAPRVNDAAAITAKYEIPTMQAADCVVCHKIIDPVAGLFQEFYALDGNGVYQPRRDGWFSDMFGAGYEGEDLPEQETWRGLPWLAERTVRDPRFAVAMVEHAWYLLSGRPALRPPGDVDHPLYAARFRAYDEQRAEFERIARRFAEDNFNFKVALKELARSPFYRADQPATVVDDPSREAEFDDLGLTRLLTPEQLERKIRAIFGDGWGRLHDQFKILYGGIDAKEVTERIADPGGAMGAIQRMMANEVACRNVARDFARPPAERLLFPAIEPGVLPDTGDPMAEAQIRAAIVHLHWHILGRLDEPDSEEVARTRNLFADIVRTAQAQERFEQVESYHCGAEREQRFPDPHYTVRAWRGVVTYLLRQHDFLYE